MVRPQPRYKPGDKIGGRYQVHKALMGGMGEVYLCLDLETNLPFALKTFQARYSTGFINVSGRLKPLPSIFENEVAIWIALEAHPNIVRCFNIEMLEKQPFMILEWVVGEPSLGVDLRRWLQKPLPLQQALDFLIDICRGLVHAAQKQPGVVHRDLKPENILITQDGFAKITDFGLAKIVQDSIIDDAAHTNIERDSKSLVSKIGNIAGTPLYMAPEQWRGEQLDARTDLYAVGCILYEMLTYLLPRSPTSERDVINYSPT